MGEYRCALGPGWLALLPGVQFSIIPKLTKLPACSDARIGPTNRVAFGLEARRWERGKRALWSAASQCWTGPRTSTTPPSRHVTSVTAQLLLRN